MLDWPRSRSPTRPSAAGRTVGSGAGCPRISLWRSSSRRTARRPRALGTLRALLPSLCRPSQRTKLRCKGAGVPKSESVYCTWAVAAVLLGVPAAPDPTQSPRPFKKLVRWRVRDPPARHRCLAPAPAGAHPQQCAVGIERVCGRGGAGAPGSGVLGRSGIHVRPCHWQPTRRWWAAGRGLGPPRAVNRVAIGSL